MSINESGLTGPAETGNSTRGSRPTLHPLHEAAMRIADIGLGRSRSKTRDLVGLLLSHGARAWRASQPRAGIHLHVTSQAGKTPVYIRVR